jgi:hypothetical protein
LNTSNASVTNISGDTIPGFTTASLRQVFHAFIVGGGMLTTSNGTIGYDREQASDALTALGLNSINWSERYPSEDAAVDAVFQLYLQKVGAKRSAA